MADQFGWDNNFGNNPAPSKSKTRRDLEASLAVTPDWAEQRAKSIIDDVRKYSRVDDDETLAAMIAAELRMIHIKGEQEGAREQHKQTMAILNGGAS